jgi:hypothetical protein
MRRQGTLVLALALLATVAQARERNANNTGPVRRGTEAGGAHEKGATVEPVSSSQHYTVVFELKRPYRENADALIAAAGFRLYGHIKQGSLSAELTRERLREVLGLTFTVSVVKGAGNCVDADAYFAEISNRGALKEKFKPLLRRVWINTDPKREVGEGDPEYKPSRHRAGGSTQGR